MNKLLNKIPLVRLIIPFTLGIITAVYIHTTSLIPFIFFLFVLSTYTLFSYHKTIRSNYKFRWIFGILIHISIFFAGYNLTSFKIKESKSFLNQSSESSVSISKIIETPQTKNRTIKLILELTNIKRANQWGKVNNNKVLAYIKKDSSSSTLDIGDVIVFKSPLKTISPPTNPHEFNYRNYLSYHFIYHEAFIDSDQWSLLSERQGNSLVEMASRIRKQLITTLRQKGLNKKELAVVSALVLGYKNEIDTQLKNAYSSAGAMHVLAVSGLHVGIIYLFFSFLLGFLDKRKYGSYLKSVILLIVLWSYALITGLSPSILRAATMFSFIIISKVMNRNNNIYNTLAASALFLLIIKPLLVMEVGFQLSYAAVLGIVIIQPWLYSFINTRWWLLDKIWEITAVSIAAQIATFPIALLYFHQFPNYFLLSNLIVIPLAIGILYLGIVTISCLSIPVLSDYLIKGLKLLTQFLNWAVINIEKLPYALSDNIRFNILDTWLIYSIIIFIILLIVYRKFKFILLASLSCILFLTTVLFRNYHDYNQKQLVIYNIPRHTVINFIDGKNSLLIADKLLIENEEKLLFHVQNNWINKGIHKKEYIPLSNSKRIFRTTNLFMTQNFLQFHNYKILFVNQNFHFKDKQQINVDLIILSKNRSYTVAQLLKSFHPKKIIVDASNSRYLAKKIKKEASILGIECHDVLKDGAFIKSIY
ncbi:MAG: ComEC/Rec2 family competence protein [Vicingus serpentipes]|nr:ComEC/Rec2 family competence protein [Vicingus serpentipes]